ERGRHVVRVDVHPAERDQQDLEAFPGRQVAIEEQDVLAADAAETAAHAVPDLAQQDLLADAQAEPGGELLQLFAERLLPPAHGARFGGRARRLQAPRMGGGPCASGSPGLEPGRRARTMIKSILVALDGSQHADSALEHALWLARRLRARVIGLHVLDIVSIEGSFLHDVSGSLGFEPYLDFSSKMREALQERGRVLLDAFTARCETEGIAYDTVLPMGIVANEICDHARTADLVVVGHRGVNEQFSTGLLGSTTESVTRKSPKPVLVTPLQFREITLPLLAYDGSQRASAALHAAAELTSALQVPLTLVHVARDDAGEGSPVLGEAQ